MFKLTHDRILSRLDIAVSTIIGLNFQKNTKSSDTTFRPFRGTFGGSPTPRIPEIDPVTLWSHSIANFACPVSVPALARGCPTIYAHISNELFCFVFAIAQ